jgi:hypothetical protein
MSNRSWAISRLRAHAPLIAIVPASQIVSSGAVGLPGSPTEELAKPFIVVRMSTVQNRLDAARSQRALVYAHDEVGSYVRIDNALKEVRAAFNISGPVVIGDTRMTAIEDEGESDDLFDDGFGTGVRYAQFRMTGRQVGS